MSRSTLVETAISRQAIVPSPDGLEIFTIGHSNLTAEDVVVMLREHAIVMLVDVRSVPYSQYTPQFNREAWERTLREAGIRYAFAGEYLGGRPTDPTCYRTGALPDGDADYLSLVDYDEVARRPWFQKGLARLVAIARESRTAIMCSEEDPDRCHRHHLIAQSLLRAGLAVTHIRKGGRLETATPEPNQLSLLP